MFHKCGVIQVSIVCLIKATIFVLIVTDLSIGKNTWFFCKEYSLVGSTLFVFIAFCHFSIDTKSVSLSPYTNTWPYQRIHMATCTSTHKYVLRRWIQHQGKNIKLLKDKNSIMQNILICQRNINDVNTS